MLLPPQEPVDADDRRRGRRVARRRDRDRRRRRRTPALRRRAQRADRPGSTRCATHGRTRCSRRRSSSEVPFLGICRGLQVLNVNRGGTLLQHLPDVVGDDRYNKGGGQFAVNTRRGRRGARSASCSTTRLDVKSYHHQAVDAARRRTERQRPRRGRHRLRDRAARPSVRRGRAVAPRGGRGRGRAPVRRPRRRRPRAPEGARMSVDAPLINPADETVLQEVEHTSLEQVDAAVARAVAAQRSWAAPRPRRPRRRPAPVRRDRRRARRGARAARGAQLRTSDRFGALGGRRTCAMS